MIVKYGTHTHADAEIAVAITSQATMAEGGLPYKLTTRWELDGRLVGTSVADLTTKIAALVAAYQQRNVDLFLLDSTTRTAHQILHAETIGGIVVVVPPAFPTGSGAEYATHRDYKIVLEADLPIASNPNPLISFRETIEISGGGPAYAFTAPIRGEPKRQIVRERTTYRATQSGQAVGFRAYPSVPSPMWPAALAEGARLQRTSPKRKGSSFYEYPVSWSYNFESATPFSGANPTVPPS